MDKLREGSTTLTSGCDISVELSRTEIRPKDSYPESLPIKK
ncbi:MAG: hypothetical protein ACTSPU_11810 [Promethearchaeota archaeon]